jgi:hypothetical protein
MAEMIDPHHLRAERLAVGADATHRHAAEIDAMISARAADQPHPPGIAPRTVIGERHLERGIGRFGARIGEEDAIEPGWHYPGEAFGEGEDQRVGELEGRRKVELCRLRLDRCGDARLAMAGVDAPQPGGRIEQAAAFARVIMHALGAFEQPRVVLEIAIIGERHPEIRHRA